MNEPYAMITRTERDRAGNAGTTEMLGSHPTVEVAKGYAEAIGCQHGARKDALTWREFSPTTWGLMNGQAYTYIRVSWIDNR
jgi:hypothetical protein